MINQTLKALLSAMENNHPCVLGEDFYVSVVDDREDYFEIHLFHEERYQWFLPEGILEDAFAYAKAFYLSVCVRCINGLPVIVLSKYQRTT